MIRLTIVVALVAALALVGAATASSGHPSSAAQTVVVPHGRPVQIAFAGDTTSIGAPFDLNALQAVQSAILAHPDVHGFPIQLNVVNAPCADPAGDVAAAQSIVANAQNVGVLGQFCSGGFDESLAVYEAADVVVVSGSATAPTLPPFGPTVFNRTAVADPGFDDWYAQVAALPRDAAWRSAFAALFGSPPTDFADLYSDAAKVLLRSLLGTSWVDRNGNLVVDRTALARSVRHTRDLRGVTCTVTIDPATGNRVDDQKALARCAG